MGNLSDFNLPSIDRNATRKAVESALEKYRILLLRQFDNQPQITQTYSIIPPSNTNKFHSSTEDAAIKNADLEREMQQYLNRMIHAVNRLTHWERAIIIKRYMDVEDVFDYEIYNDIGMSERKYYRVKARAFYKLAFLLKIEVYEEQGVTA
ncbi:ArpU family transcriptional regulator [Mesobacillus subterraneus]|uniref:ArpU family phage packaging/lysis transcriptional regulator n=1 Tax=Mesobacillus subterraneus TaxID=285983 RepID=UPI00203D4336|nr:ArpU family phage packaging/lysis transcriptional regulator [Mesobacillus subterraneus]MCM3663469.1 ArpU family transcriptional regulator [Mesobacillus subterraneus]MCM3683239.1 ArpU family transcriptional regulator [Mesobacillus subterraneus]